MFNMNICTVVCICSSDFREEDIQSIVNIILDDSNNAFNQNVEAQTNTFNSLVETSTQEISDLAAEPISSILQFSSML